MPRTLRRRGQQTNKNATERQRLQPYEGNEPKLLVAIDIGTTFSAASFCLLKPRASPSLEDVQNWPGQFQSDTKIPSVIYYDHDGMPQIWGAQTLNDDYITQAEENKWTKVEWFKLALRPTTGSSEESFSFTIPRLGYDLPTLPILLPIEKVYTDFLRLIFGHTKEYFCKHHASGREIWEKCFPTMEFVLSIPCGWEIKQQFQIRSAAIAAGFIDVPSNGSSSEQEGMRRIRFVSEAEAAMIYAAQSGRIDPWLRTGEDIILCDVGGGTIDITAYTVKNEDPLQFREKMASQCIVAGAVVVNQEARRYFSDRLRGSPWDTPQKIEYLLTSFENGIKRTLNNVSSELGVGRTQGWENIPEAGIRNGRFYIPGAKAASFFEPPLNAIKTGIKRVIEAERSIKAAYTFMVIVSCESLTFYKQKIVIVGGLMNNSYAFQQLEVWGHSQNITLSKPDGHMAKCVSHGALLWFLLKPVTSHVARFHYGTNIALPLAECEGELSGRNVSLRADGVQVVQGIWHTIVAMESHLGTDTPVVSEYYRIMSEEEIQRSSNYHEKIYICRSKNRPHFTTVAKSDGNLETPRDNVEQCCSVVVDLKSIFDDAPFIENTRGGERYKVLDFGICIVFDGMNLKAYTKWSSKKRTKRGEAIILPASA